MTTEEVSRRLSQPRIRTDAGEFASLFSYAEIEQCVEGHGVLAGRTSLLNKVRGAYGQALLSGACEAVRRRRACHCRRTCAADVFFGTKPSLKSDFFQGEICKPFVLHAARAGESDLLAGMHVFGFAGEWLPEARHAFAAALRDGVDWQALAGGTVFVPHHRTLKSPRVRRQTIQLSENVPESVILTFQSDVDAKNVDPFAQPVRILERLVRRVTLVARWCDVDLVQDYSVLERACEGLDLQPEVGADLSEPHIRRSGRTGKLYANPVARRDLRITGDLALLWPYLKIGEITHIGRGAVAGLGRYRLTEV